MRGEKREDVHAPCGRALHKTRDEGAVRQCARNVPFTRARLCAQAI